MTTVIATFNHNKLNDLLVYLSPHINDLRPLSEWTEDDVEETGLTFEENALIKAKYCFEVTKHPSIADDSGFCMKSLEDLPGIYAARFAKMPDGTTDFKYAFHILENKLGLKDPCTEFVCALAYVDEVRSFVVRGVVKGFFDFSKQDIPGFGYTPIFVPEENNPNRLSLAEMGDTLRRTYSARRYAVEGLLLQLSKT